MAKSRGAGAAQRGFEYDVYRKGGKVKKYAEGGALRDEKGDYKRDPATGTREYASFSDLMGDLFGRKKTEPDLEKTRPQPGAGKEQKATEDEGTPNSRERISGVHVMQGVDTAPPRPQRSGGQQRRRRLRDASPSNLPSQVDIDAASPMGRAYAPRGSGRQNVPMGRPRARDEQGRILQDLASRYMPDELATALPSLREQVYRKGGSVKMAGGGSCRGMGAATKGGKYTIK
jgi:hypothetical protein